MFCEWFVFSPIQRCFSLQWFCFKTFIRSVKINFIRRWLSFSCVYSWAWPWGGVFSLVILSFWGFQKLSLRCLFAITKRNCFINLLVSLHAVTRLLSTFISCRWLASTCSMARVLLLIRWLTALLNLFVYLYEFLSGWNIANWQTHQITHLSNDASSLSYFSTEFLSLFCYLLELMT